MLTLAEAFFASAEKGTRRSRKFCLPLRGTGPSAALAGLGLDPYGGTQRTVTEGAGDTGCLQPKRTTRGWAAYKYPAARARVTPSSFPGHSVECGALAKLQCKPSRLYCVDSNDWRTTCTYFQTRQALTWSRYPAYYNVRSRNPYWTSILRFCIQDYTILCTGVAKRAGRHTPEKAVASAWQSVTPIRNRPAGSSRAPSSRSRIRFR